MSKELNTTEQMMNSIKKIKTVEEVDTLIEAVKVDIDRSKIIFEKIIIFFGTTYLAVTILLARNIISKNESLLTSVGAQVILIAGCLAIFLFIKNYFKKNVDPVILNHKELINRKLDLQKQKKK